MEHAVRIIVIEGAFISRTFTLHRGTFETLYSLGVSVEACKGSIVNGFPSGLSCLISDHDGTGDSFCIVFPHGADVSPTLLNAPNVTVRFSGEPLHRLDGGGLTELLSVPPERTASVPKRGRS